jgi:hypothetical protein
MTCGDVERIQAALSASVEAEVSDSGVRECGGCWAAALTWIFMTLGLGEFLPEKD